MKVTIRWGDPWDLDHNRTDVVDLSLSQQKVQDTQGLGYIHGIFSYTPQRVVPGAVFSDGLNMYSVLATTGPALNVGGVYVCEGTGTPVRIVKRTHSKTRYLYVCKIGFHGQAIKTRTLYEEEVLKLLRGKTAD